VPSAGLARRLALAQPRVLVGDQGDRDPGTRAAPQARATARSSSGRLVARVEIFWEKTRVTPAAASESIWVSRDWRTVEARE
jgi:hypothetical protein